MNSSSKSLILNFSWGLLGFENINAVKSAKCYRVVIDGNPEDALAQAEKMCQRLLANPVVHEYSISVID